MKRLFTILFVCICSLSYGQDTLYEEKAFMYSVEYVLNKDNTFTYRFGHCTGSDLGRGIYVKTNNKIVFTFDEYPLPKPGKTEVFTFYDSTLTQTKIEVYETFKDTIAYPYVVVTPDKQMIQSKSDGSVFIDKSITGKIKPFALGLNLDTITIVPQYNVYKIYTNEQVYFLDTAVPKSEVRVFTKTTDGKYFFKKPRYKQDNDGALIENSKGEFRQFGWTKVFFRFKNKPA